MKNTKKLADYNYFLYFCRKIEKYGRIGYDLCDDYGRCRCYSTLASYKMGQEILGESLNDLLASKMNTLALTFAICLVPATAFLIWLFTPWGKKWSKEL